MRILLFFDLPIESVEEKRNYTIFRKNLFKLGFIMMQYSVYHKCVNVATKIEREEEKITKILPPYGNIRVLTVTEHQYQKMKIMIGGKTFNEQINEQPNYIKV
ncbi:MAG: CRISPR-associated endonuclease Cas2 [Mycoplasmataceae bacterium]|jgi:CRISPR-associated protein Cas2|nr:CRISPR-associated endonuclease Cas2 [Mycoplasmataceae bacterium]